MAIASLRPLRARVSRRPGAGRPAGPGAAHRTEENRGHPPGTAPRRLAGTVLGVLQTLAITGAFAAAAPVLGPLLEAPHPAGARPGYPAPGMEPGGEPGDEVREILREIWLIDGFNVIQVAARAGGQPSNREGWWREPARTALLERSGCLADPEVDPGTEVWVVFDGPHPPPEPLVSGCARGVFAPSADDWILERLRAHPDPAGVRVVTADRPLAERARHRGAVVVGPHEFLERCSRPGESAEARGPGAPESSA